MIISLNLFFKLGRVNIKTEGKEKLPDDGNFLLVCNHTSVYDPMVTITELSDTNIAFVSKKENLDVPFAGRYMHKSGCIPLDRENARNAVTAINKASENILNRVCPMCIYPEGMVNKTGKGILEFRNGAFKIAKKAKCPVVIAVIENTRDINDYYFRKRTFIKLKICEVLHYESISFLKTAEIGEVVKAIMVSNLS